VCLAKIYTVKKIDVEKNNKCKNEWHKYHQTLGTCYPNLIDVSDAKKLSGGVPATQIWIFQKLCLFGRFPDPIFL